MPWLAKNNCGLSLQKCQAVGLARWQMATNMPWLLWTVLNLVCVSLFALFKNRAFASWDFGGVSEYEPHWHDITDPTTLLHAVFITVAEFNGHSFHLVPSWIISVFDRIWRIVPAFRDRRTATTSRQIGWVLWRR